jgi:hypothetical protein
VTFKVAADHLSVPRPVIVRVTGRVQRDDALAALEEALQCIALFAHEPLGFRLLRIGRSAHEHDGLVGLELFRSEDFGILGGIHDVARLGANRFQRFDGGRNRVMAKAGAAGIHQHVRLFAGDGWQRTTERREGKCDDPERMSA